MLAVVKPVQHVPVPNVLLMMGRGTTRNM